MPSRNELPENNTRMFVWLVAGLTVGAIACAACCGVGVWFAADRIGDVPILGDFAEAKLPPAVFESPEEKRAWAASAFADPPPDGGFDRRSVETFFRRVLNAGEANDHEAFRRLVDADRLWRTVKERGLIRQLTRGDDRGAPEAYRAVLEVPGAFERFYLQAVTPGRAPDEAVVYVVLWEDGWAHEYRWWLARDGRQWKAFDWEALQLGVRNTWRQAAYEASLPGITGYDAAWEAVAKADELIEKGEPGAAAEQIRLAASKTVPAELKAEHTLTLAYAWARCSRPLRESETYATATDARRQSAPGLLLGDATAAYATGDYDRALELIARFEREVGGGPNVDSVRADSLYALGRTAEASTHYRRALRYSPDDLTLQANYARSLPAERRGDLGEFLRGRPDPMAAASELSALLSGEASALAAIESLLAEVAPASPERQLVAGRRLAALGKTNEAADAYLAAYNAAAAVAGDALGAETDPVSEEPADPKSSESPKHSPEQTRAAATAETAFGLFHDVLWEEGRVLETYERAPDKAKSFEYLFYQADEYGLSLETRKALLEKHAATAPDDGSLLSRRAEIASESGDHALAAELWSRLLESGPEYSHLGSTLVSALFELGRHDQAVKLARDRPEDVGLFATVTTRLDADGRHQEVLDLADAARPEGRYPERTVGLARAKALSGLGRSDEAKTAFAELYRSAEQPWERQAACRAWLEAAAKADWPAEGLIESVGREAFADLVTAAGSNDEQLQGLIDAWRERGGDEKAALPAVVGLRWEVKDYAGVVAAVEQAGGPTAVPAGSTANVIDRHVRSLIRLGRAEEAVASASYGYDLIGDAALPTLAAVAAGKWQEAERIGSFAEDYSLDRLYEDEDAGLRLRSEAASSFRRAVPRSVSSLAGRGVAVLMLKDAWTGDALATSRQFEAAFRGGATVKPAEGIEPDSADITAQILVELEGRKWLVTAAAGRHSPEDADLLKNATLRSAVETHRGWIALDTIGGNAVDEQAGRTAAAELVRAVGVDRVAAVQVTTEHGSFLLPPSAELTESLAAAGFDPEEVDGAQQFWLSRDYEEDEPKPGFAALQRAFAEAFTTREAGDPFQVTVALELPHGRASLTLPVERVALTTYGVEATALLDEAAARLFGAEPKEPFLVGPWSIRDWSYTSRGKTVRAADLLSTTTPTEPAQ